MSLVFLVSSIYARDRKNINQPNGFFLQTILFKGEEGNKLFVFYKIENDRLVFIKENGYYTAGFSFTFELYDESGFVKRNSKSHNVVINSPKPNSSQDRFTEGFISFEIDDGKYELKPYIQFDNSGKRGALPAKNVTTSNDYEFFWGKVDSLNEQIKIINTNQLAPFSREKYDLVFVTNNSVSKGFQVTFGQNDAPFIKKFPIEIFPQKLIISDDKSGKISSLPITSNLKFFYLKGISAEFSEGDLRIIFDDKYNYKRRLTISSWLDKPRSLHDLEFAINLLSVFENPKLVDSLLDYPDEQLYSELFKHWAKYDRSPNTKFNEVMDEFYSRADFATNEYRSVDNKNGAKSDRGKIYIIYGAPDIIQRSYDDLKQAYELWQYKEINKEFVFVDRSGLGNYKLKK